VKRRRRGEEEEGRYEGKDDTEGGKEGEQKYGEV
jgi:hypothetical protein